MRRSFLILALVAALVAITRWPELLQPPRPPPTELDLAFQAVQADPRSPAAWAALGDVQANADDPVAAEQSYETALRQGSQDPQVVGRLGFLLYAHGEDARALKALEEAQRGGADLPMLAFTIEALKQRLPTPASVAPASAPAPATPSSAPAPTDAGEADAQVRTPPSTCAVPLWTSAVGTRELTLYVKGEPLHLIYDTGATITVLAAKALPRLGLVADDSRPLRAITAAGPVQFSTTNLPELTLLGRRAGPFLVAVCPDCGGPESDGLLGLDAQAALGLELDLAAGLVRFRDCR